MPVTLAILAALAELAGDAARSALRYQREAVLDGEWWRLLSGNLVHLGPRHLVLNLAGLALVSAIGGRSLEGWRGAAVACASMAGVGVGLLVCAAQVSWYVGLSGALHGLLAAMAVDAVADPALRRWGAALGLGLVAKLAWEQAIGPVPLTAAAAGGPVIVAAHLYGAIAGALSAIAIVAFERGRSGAQV